MENLRGATLDKVRGAIAGDVTLELTNTPNRGVVAHLKDVRYAL